MQDLLEDLTSGDDERAERSIPTLVEMGAAAIPALLELTRAPETDSRWWAVRALAASPLTQTEDLLPLLSDPSPEVRSAAVLAICEHPNESAVPALLQTLADDDPLTAGLAGTALVKIGIPSVAGLLDTWKEAKPSTRILILRALAEIKDHRAIPLLMKSMSEDSAVLQYWAVEGLNRLGLDMVYIKP